MKFTPKKECKECKPLYIYILTFFSKVSKKYGVNMYTLKKCVCTYLLLQVCILHSFTYFYILTYFHRNSFSLTGNR